jgi:hypothetical protein
VGDQPLTRNSHLFGAQGAGDDFLNSGGRTVTGEAAIFLAPLFIASGGPYYRQLTSCTARRMRHASPLVRFRLRSGLSAQFREGRVRAG